MDLTPILALIPPQDLVYVPALWGVCSLLASLMPPPGNGTVTGNPAYAAAYKLVNFLAINLGHARNASAPERAPASNGATP